MVKKPMSLLKPLVIFLFIFSSPVHALMVCTDSGLDQVFNGQYDGICALGPSDSQDITEIRALRQEVAESMAEEYGGECTYVYGRSGRVTIKGCTKKACPDCLGTWYVVNYPLRVYGMPLYYVSDEVQQPMTCRAEAEADPCDPASGMVFLTETDIVDNGTGLSFTRHYQTHALNQSNQNLGVNWRHNHVSQLDARPKQITQHRLPVNYSSYYSTRADACLFGGETIKSKIFSGQLGNAALEYVDSTCRLKINGNVVATLAIKVADKQRPISGAALAHNIIRPDGKTYNFVNNSSGWVNLGML